MGWHGESPVHLCASRKRPELDSERSLTLGFYEDIARRAAWMAACRAACTGGRSRTLRERRAYGGVVRGNDFPTRFLGVRGALPEDSRLKSRLTLWRFAILSLTGAIASYQDS